MIPTSGSGSQDARLIGSYGAVSVAFCELATTGSDLLEEVVHAAAQLGQSRQICRRPKQSARKSWRGFP